MDELSKIPREPQTVYPWETQSLANRDSDAEKRGALRIRWEFWKQIVVGGILGAFERQDS